MFFYNMEKCQYKKKVCYYCGEEIELSKNIYMFQDNSFCTKICRYEIMKNNLN